VHQGDLDIDHIVPVNPEVFRVGDQLLSGMDGEKVKAVPLRDSYGLDKSSMNTVRDCSALLDTTTITDIDIDDRRCASSGVMFR